MATENEQYMFLSVEESTSGNALYIAEAIDVNDLKFKKIADGFEYDYSVVDHIKDQIILRTNQDAPKGKLVLVDFNNPVPDNWKSYLDEKENVLESVGIYGGQLFAEYLEDASSKAYFYDLNGNYLSELKLPAIGTLFGFNGK